MKNKNEEKERKKKIQRLNKLYIKLAAKLKHQ